MQQESQRLQCLQRMGIKPLQARHALAGAASSFAFYHDQVAAVTLEYSQTVSDDLSPDAPPSSPTATMPSKKAADILTALLDDQPSGDVLPVKTATHQPVPEKEDDHPDPAKKFRLRYVRIGACLFLLSQPTLAWKNGNKEITFMRDIALALTGQVIDTKTTDQLTWPPSRHLSVGSDALIMETLTPFLQQLTLDEKDPFVIKLGLKSHPYLGRFIETALPNCRHIDLQPIGDYCQQPESKRLLWQTLQAYH